MKKYKLLAIMIIVTMLSGSVLGTSTTVWYQSPGNNNSIRGYGYNLYINSTVGFSSECEDNWIDISTYILSVVNDTASNTNDIKIVITAVGYSNTSEQWEAIDTDSTGVFWSKTVTKPYEIEIGASQSNVDPNVRLNIQTAYNSGVNVSGNANSGQNVYEFMRKTAEFAADEVIGSIPYVGTAYSVGKFLYTELSPKPVAEVMNVDGLNGAGSVWEKFYETNYENDWKEDISVGDYIWHGHAIYVATTEIIWTIPNNEQSTYTLHLFAKNIMGVFSNDELARSEDGAQASVDITIKKGSISLLNAYTENVNPSAPKNTFYTKDYTMSNQEYHVSPSLIVRGVSTNGIPIHIYVDWGDGQHSSVYRYTSGNYYSFSHTYYPGLPEGSRRTYTITAKVYTDGYYGGWSDSKSITITVVNNGKQSASSGGGGVGGGGIGCPYLYVWNGSDYAKDNVILIGSELIENFKIKDYMKIDKKIVKKENEYTLKISEFERERTKLDSVQLMTVDHPPEVKIATTLHNEIVTFSNPIPPQTCKDKNGKNALSNVSHPDNISIEGDYGDFIIANFGNISSSHVKLLLKTDVKPNPGGINPVSYPENHSDVGMIFAIKNKDGTWTNISEFYPRPFWYTDAFILDPYLSNAAQPLQIAVGWLGYHKLDWIAIDATQDVPVETHTYAPIKAELDGKDVLDTLLYTDNDNVTLVPHQNITLEFPYEEPENGTVRDLIFISTGRYDTIPRTENIGFDVYQYVKMSVKLCGKPGNTVNINILEDGKKIGNVSITRERGNPNNNIKNISFRKYLDREYELEIVNNGRKGCNPIEIKFFSVFSQRNETIRVKVKAGHSRIIDIEETLNDVLTGEKAFLFELVPPYYDIPQNLISEISWNFGDNATDFGPAPIHFYNGSGEYNVTMTIRYKDNLEASITKTVDVS